MERSICQGTELSAISSENPPRSIAGRLLSVGTRMLDDMHQAMLFRNLMCERAEFQDGAEAEAAVAEGMEVL